MAKKTQEVVNIERFFPNYENGLSNEQVESRHSQGLLNISNDNSGRGYGKIIVKNFVTFFNIIYVILTILQITAGISEIMNYSFIFIVLANTCIGTFQEIKSKRTINKLKILSTPTVTVIREGQKQEVNVNDLVLDEVIYLTPGREIVTDAIIVNGEVEVNESQLTGESIAIRKNIGDTLYSGSYIVSGNCHAQVERIGADTEIEKLSTEAKTHKAPKSEILSSLNSLLRVIAIILVVTGILLFLQGMSDKGTLSDGIKQFFQFVKNPKSMKHVYDAAIKSTTTALLGMIPSGLYLFTSLALFLGALRLANRKTLVQDIYCIEMLARVDVLCLDKTGTITDGTMTVIRFTEHQKNNNYNIPEIIASMNEALQETNSTQKALEQYFGFSKKLIPEEVVPFSSDNKYSAVTFEDGTYILGAPEFVLKNNIDKYISEINDYANQGLRVVALVHSPLPLKDGKIQKVPKLVSLILIEDQIRKEAYDTIKYFRENGVEVKVISGDNPVTVSEVARRVGIENADDYISLDGLNDEEVYQVANSYTVFGRVKPNQKKIIVTALKDAKKTVAMTGDGVNDILALREADCSIAMASGSDAVKSVSQLVLLDSNFASMPHIVNEGRRVINNVQQTSRLFLVKTLFIIILATLTVLGFTGALSPGGSNEFPLAGASQLVMLELFAIGIPAFFLSLQPNFKKIKGNFLLNVIKSALPGALAVTVEVIIIYLLAKPIGLSDSADLPQLKTIVAISITVTCLMVLYMSCRPFTWKKIALFLFCVFGSVIITYASIKNVVLFDNTVFRFSFYEQFKLCSLSIPYPEGTIIPPGQMNSNPAGTMLAIILSMMSYVLITAFSYIIGFIDQQLAQFIKNKKINK